MDSKKKIGSVILMVAATLLSLTASGQDVARIQLMDKQYSYELARDSITVFFNILDSNGEREKTLSPEVLSQYLVFKEDGRLIPEDKTLLSRVGSGQRIPSDYTFSVLVDLGIPNKGKEQIAELVGELISSAPDSCVYLSFFGDDVQATQMVTAASYQKVRPVFKESAQNKYLYSALYAKLSEFEQAPAALDGYVKKQPGYVRNSVVSDRALLHPDKNILFVFTEGHSRPSLEENLAFLEISEYQADPGHAVPVVYAFYYTEDGNDPEIRRLLEGICTPAGLPERKGAYMPADNLEQVMSDFEQVVSDKSYDYAFTYKAFDKKTYSGRTGYEVEWKGTSKGQESFSIGSPERPWPERPETAGDSAIKYLVALLVAFLVFAFFFLLMKVVIPGLRSKSFENKYYKTYVPEENVRRRVCHYCGQEIMPGQRIVVRCKHVMHVECWKQNDYRCSEYGQNCKDGIQAHVHWKELFTKRSFHDSLQTLSGIVAALVAWLAYELLGRGGFSGIAEKIVSFSLKGGLQESFFTDCVEKTSAFLMIGLLLGFFLSLAFRYNDEYRTKDWKIMLKIVGLSILTGLVGMLAFALGVIILCLLVSVAGTSYIPWYCSLPAYVLFSLAVAAMLSWKSSIPLKSALLGGGIASIIGFIVLFFSSTARGWMNMLLDFIIYGGGLGASLVTVRTLSERYFLVIQNGVRAGQRIPIHKWMNATGGGNKVSIGMTGECEIQMNWEKSNKVAKEHARLFVDQEKTLPVLKPLATGVLFNSRMELSVGKPYVLTNGDTFKIGDTIFQYVESE